jgi:hypothetical protein
VTADAHRLEALAKGVLGPLVLGGQMHLVPPFGPKLALSIDGAPRISDDDLRTKVDVARVRIARTIAPLDTLPDIAAADWALVAALNDLLQATNHHLSGPFTRSRHSALVAAVEDLVGRIPPPRTLLDAINRHATLARVTELVRTDTKVSWWSGSASFRGEPPSTRLFKWKELRRVRSEENTVAIADLADGISAVKKDIWLSAFGLWLHRSPITDIATLSRTVPAFAWSAPTLAFVATPTGAKLAARALSATASSSDRKSRVAPALEASINHMPKSAARDIALRFAEEAVARLRAADADKNGTPKKPEPLREEPPVLEEAESSDEELEIAPDEAAGAPSEA